MFSLVPKIVRDKLSLVFSQMFPDKKKLLLQTEEVLHRLMLLLLLLLPMLPFFLNRIFLEMEKNKTPRRQKVNPRS